MDDRWDAPPARAEGDRIDAFGGVQKVAPILAGTFLVAGLSGLALPGLSSFVSEFLVLVGTFSRYPIAAGIATFGTVLAALYILLMYQRTMTGPKPTFADGETPRDLSIREKVVVVPIIAAPSGLVKKPTPKVASADSSRVISDSPGKKARPIITAKKAKTRKS